LTMPLHTGVFFWKLQKQKVVPEHLLRERLELDSVDAIYLPPKVRSFRIKHVRAGTTF
jgi:hypothetical protein